MPDFEKDWSGKEGFGKKLRRTLSPETNIKERVQSTARAIDSQGQRLDLLDDRLREKDRRYFNDIIEAMKMKDQERATVLANELAEIRKSMRTIGQAKLAMDRISLRLSTVKDIGDMVATMAPAMAVLRSIGGSLSGIFPQVDEEFGSLAELTSNVLNDAGQMGFTVNLPAANEEAEKILREAETQVEGEMGERLPSVPEFIDT